MLVTAWHRVLLRLVALCGHAPYWPTGQILTTSRICETASIFAFVLTTAMFLATTLQSYRDQRINYSKMPPGYFQLVTLSRLSSDLIPVLSSIILLMYRNKIRTYFNELSAFIHAGKKVVSFRPISLWTVLIASYLGWVGFFISSNFTLNLMNFLLTFSTMSSACVPIQFLTYLNLVHRTYVHLNASFKSHPATLSNLMNVDLSAKDLAELANWVTNIYSCLFVLEVSCFAVITAMIFAYGGLGPALFYTLMGTLPAFLFVIFYIYCCQDLIWEVRPAPFFFGKRLLL